MALDLSTPQQQLNIVTNNIEKGNQKKPCNCNGALLVAFADHNILLRDILEA